MPNKWADLRSGVAALQTYSLNALAESFEIDRSTMVRTMRNVPPDVEKTRGRPTWKISTAASALEEHRRRAGTSKGGYVPGEPDPRLTALFAQSDVAEKAMLKLRTVEQRRAAAFAMAPMIVEMHRMMRQVTIQNGHAAELADYRADHYQAVFMRVFESACEWTERQCAEQMGRVTYPKEYAEEMAG
jgi:hypothetical protein